MNNDRISINDAKSIANGVSILMWFSAQSGINPHDNLSFFKLLIHNMFVAFRLALGQNYSREESLKFAYNTPIVKSEFSEKDIQIAFIFSLDELHTQN